MKEINTTLSIAITILIIFITGTLSVNNREVKSSVITIEKGMSLNSVSNLLLENEIIGGVILYFITSGHVEIKSIEDFFLMTLTGILGGTAAILFIYSYRLISASKMASFEYLGIPSSFVLGWIFFKEAPWEQLFPGVIAIVLAGMIIIWRDKVKKKSIKGNNQFN